MIIANRLHFVRSFFAFLFLVVSFSFQPKEKVNYLSVKISDLVKVKLPESFMKLTDDQIADKIIASRKPLAMYSSPSGTVDFSVSVGNSSKNPWQNDDLKLMAQFQKSNINQLFTSVIFSTDKIQKVNGQSFAIFEFTSEVKENGKPPIRKYNHLRYTIYKKNMMVFSFICPEKERPVYQGMGETIMSSIKF